MTHAIGISLESQRHPVDISLCENRLSTKTARDARWTESVGITNVALAAGANDFLTKPLVRTEVLLRVRNLSMTRSLCACVQQHNQTLRRTLARRQECERDSDRL